MKIVPEYNSESVIEITREPDVMAKIYVSSFVDQVNEYSTGDCVRINKEEAFAITCELKSIFNL